MGGLRTTRPAREDPPKVLSEARPIEARPIMKQGSDPVSKRPAGLPGLRLGPRITTT